MYGGVTVWARYCGVRGAGPGWIEVEWEAGGGVGGGGGSS